MNYPRDPALAARIEAVYQDANRKAEARAARIADIEAIVTAWENQIGIAAYVANDIHDFAVRYAEAEGATD